MKIDRKLNLVLRLGDDGPEEIHIHHSPIMQAVFERHYMFIAKSMNRMYSEGLHPLIAMHVAYFTMRDLAKSEPRYKSVPDTLFAEIQRMTNALVLKDRRWEVVPFQEAIDAKLISDADVLEVMNSLCFFTSASWVHGSKEMAATCDLLTETGLLTTSLDVTEYRNGLPTSTPGETTGEKAIVSSIPS